MAPSGAVPDYLSRRDGDLSGLRVERDHHTRVEGFDPACRERFEEAVLELERIGAEIVEVHFEGYPIVTTAAMVTSAAESLAYHRKDLQERFNEYGREARASLALGAFYSSADYVQAQRVRAWGLATLERILRRCDVIVTPTIGLPVPYLGDDYWAMMQWRYTPAWNHLGTPAMSVPMGPIGGGMPSGLQIIGDRFDDATVLRVADAYQQETHWHDLVPTAVNSRVV